MNVRLSPEIHRRIALLAQSSGKTINSLIKDAVENQLKFSGI
ncbi:toxin-antitoxin system HicB family antitoxin [Culturomica massiliensis]|nr:toxin-antitoxin system HicB family antitoxin [Culturomica massiliensis]